MKQLLLSVLTTILLLPATQAQQLFLSKPQKLNLQSNSIEVIGRVGRLIYTYRASKDGYFMDAYNDSMRLKATIALDFLPRKLEAIGFINDGQGMKVVYQTSENAQLYLFIASLDDKARLLGSPQLVDSVKNNWFATEERQFYFAASIDKSRIMVYALGTADRNEVVLRTSLLSASLNPLAYSEQIFEYRYRPQFGQAVVANDGSFYFCLFPNRELHINAQDGWLYSLTADGTSLHEVEVAHSELHIAAPLIKLDQQQEEVYFCAPYSSSAKSSVEGLAIGRFSPRQDTLNKLQLISFSDKLRNSTDLRRKKRAFNDYDIRDLIIKNDGGVVVVSEKFYHTSKPVNNYGMDAFYSGMYARSPYFSNAVMEYHYGDILSLDVNAAGVIEWSTFIRKEQFVESSHNLKSSYLMLNAGASLVFLFNDFSGSQTSVNVAVMAVDGSLQLRKLPHFRNVKAQLMPLLGKQTGLTEMVLPMIERNELSFARLQF